ncbi:MAG TPA: DUF1223 domain-containing protein [Bacteroidia bacterium]|nr:DUF1223 domain-containing protein [Bacteroidia bacterium]
MTRIVRMLTVFFLLNLAATAQTSSFRSGFAVLELFTSESDANSPAGDAVFQEVIREARKAKQPVIGLAFHVDYWNKGSWKDPFSRNAFTFRQENYSRAFPQKELYTPQLIVNGRAQMTASSRDSVKAAIKKALISSGDPGFRLQVDSVLRDTLFLTAITPKPGVNWVVRVAVTEDGLKSEVKAGPNKGKILEHDAVVRLWYSTGAKSKSLAVKVPLKGLKLNDRMRLVGLLQEKKTMKILGASESGFD